MSQDPVVSLLLKAPLTPSQRRAASEAFTSSANEDDLQTKMETMKLPRAVMADLWDLKYAQPPQPTGEVSAPEGSALGRFASNLGEQINPVTIVKGLANAAMHPIDTGAGILHAANEQRLKAHDEFEKGNYGQMAARSVAAAIPILGPAAAEAGEQIGSGDIAGGLGKAAGILGPMLAVGALRKSPATNAVKADALEREAVQQVAQNVLAPKDRKYQPGAQKVAPELLKRGVEGDRTALAQYAEDLIADAQNRIDDVIQSYPASQTLSTGPVVGELTSAMDRLMFDGPTGPTVNPAFQQLHGELAKLKTFVEGRGPQMSFEDMRRLRAQLDRVSSEAGSFAKAAGDRGLSAAHEATMDTANAIRRQIAAERPDLAGPNADMHLGLTLKDILDPVKGRPAAPPSATTGATGGLHATGALIGSMLDVGPLRPLAAYVASKVIPALREAQVSPQNQLRLANDKFKLAQALKAGKVSTAQKVLLNMSMYIPGFSGIGRITEPSGASK